MDIKKDSPYATIQVDRGVKIDIKAYCLKKGFKIGKFVERLFLHHVSGSQV